MFNYLLTLYSYERTYTVLRTLYVNGYANLFDRAGACMSRCVSVLCPISSAPGLLYEPHRAAQNVRGVRRGNVRLVTYYVRGRDNSLDLKGGAALARSLTALTGLQTLTMG